MRIKKEFTVTPSQEAHFIAEAFGIESGYNNQVLNLEIPDELPQITYITGESGCGKTTLLKELGFTGNISEDELPKKPLFKWRESQENSIKLMSMVGLSDAIHFVSYYDELSDSQQFRAKLYYLLLDDREEIVLDEFLSTLDRETAKSVAFLFQKVLRKLGKKAILSTAHTDLEGYLKPDLTIKGKAFPSRWEVKYNGYNLKDNPFLKNIKIKHKDSKWYRENSLGELHYKGKYTGGVKDYIGAYYKGKLIGLLLATYRMWDGGRRIARLVVHPSYRSLGIGSFLTEYYLDKEPEADVVASMARFNKVFEKAGMERIEDSISKPPSGLKTDLKNKGFNKEKWFKKSYCIKFMSKKENRAILKNYLNEIGYLINPGGKYLEEEELIPKFMRSQQQAGRVLWNLRPKRMAKYEGKGGD